MNYKLGYSTDKLISLWLEYTDVNDLSKKNYEFSIKKFIAFLLKIKEIVINNYDDLFYYVERKHLNEYKKYLMHNKSAATVDNYLTSVRLFFNYLANNDFIDNNIAFGIKSPRRRREYKKSALTLEQAKELIKTCENETNGKRNKAMIMLMLINGFRKNEVLELRVGDIEKRFIDGFNVVGVWVYGKGQTEKTFTSLADNVYQAIEDYLLEFKNLNDDDYLFIGNGNNNKHRRLTNEYVSMLVKKKLKQIGLTDKYYTCHSLRHTAATLLLQNNQSITDVKSFLRHKNISTTSIYLESIEKNNILKNSGAKRLGKLFE